ncbi:MAG: sigma-54-dependent Fis family transcriptional regulator [Planctomycetes bacterium]|nr:sigma-54-dependent Fis family transcriptional regulator [Planctomycetota bacterium]
MDSEGGDARSQLDAEFVDWCERAKGLDPEQRVDLVAEIRSRLIDLERTAYVEGDEPPLPQRFGIIGDSDVMHRVFERLEKMAASDYAVLVTGESGTGKELVARALHMHGPRKHKPFLSENCAAIPETLLESILFGHAKGAFTGAHKDNAGHFVRAHEGTLFLDELGDMPLSMQSKLLRVLQDGEVRPVGSEKTRHVDVRLVAATNKDLQLEVREKRFREDLLFRLNVLEITLPPLRERGRDILHIAEFFLRRARKELGRELRLGKSAEEWLMVQNWPGNVRQLENEIRRAAALATGTVLESASFSGT